MKNITKISTLFLALFISVSLSSCSDDDGGGGSGTPSGEFVKAKVNGEDFASSTSYDLVAASNPTSSALVVQGSNSSGEAIQLMLMNFDGVGTYDVSNMLNGQAMYTIANPFTSYSSAAEGGASGEIEITLIDDEKVEGTFSFTGRKAEEGATETVTVTEGQFRANFQ